MDFSYLASSVMHFYSVGYTELLSMPISAFWELSRCVHRIQAEEDLRMINLLGASFNGDKDYINSLKDARGAVVDGVQESFDSKGFNRLKYLIGRG